MGDRVLLFIDRPEALINPSKSCCFMKLAASLENIFDI